MKPTARDQTSDTALLAAKLAAALGIVFALVALGWRGPRAGLSVFLGAAVAVANLLALRGLIRVLLRPERPRAELGWILLALGKILLLFGGLWFLARSGHVEPLALLVGYGVLPLGITLSALWPVSDES